MNSWAILPTPNPKHHNSGGFCVCLLHKRAPHQGSFDKAASRLRYFPSDHLLSHIWLAMTLTMVGGLFLAAPFAVGRLKTFQPARIVRAFGNSIYLGIFNLCTLSMFCVALSAERGCKTAAFTVFFVSVKESASHCLGTSVTFHRHRTVKTPVFSGFIIPKRNPNGVMFVSSQQGSAQHRTEHGGARMLCRVCLRKDWSLSCARWCKDVIYNDQWRASALDGDKWNWLPKDKTNTCMSLRILLGDKVRLVTSA